MMTFAEFFREHRLSNGLGLREFCLKFGFDAGNISRLERGMLSPPRDRDKLESYATALGLARDSDDWVEFFDLAAISAGRIPDRVLSDADIVEKLPLLFRTVGNSQADAEQVEKLIEEIRRL